MRDHLRIDPRIVPAPSAIILELTAILGRTNAFAYSPDRSLPKFILGCEIAGGTCPQLQRAGGVGPVDWQTAKDNSTKIKRELRFSWRASRSQETTMSTVVADFSGLRPQSRTAFQGTIDNRNRLVDPSTLSAGTLPGMELILCKVPGPRAQCDCKFLSPL